MLTFYTLQQLPKNISYVSSDLLASTGTPNAIYKEFSLVLVFGAGAYKPPYQAVEVPRREGAGTEQTARLLRSYPAHPRDGVTFSLISAARK